MWNQEPYYPPNPNYDGRKTSGKEKLQKYCRIANAYSDQYLKCNPMRMWETYQSRAHQNGTNVALEAGRDVEREFREAFQKSQAIYQYLMTLSGNDLVAAYWQYKSMLVDHHRDKLNRYCIERYRRPLF